MCLISLKALMSLKSITENTHIISNYVILNILKLFTCLIAPLNVCLFNKIEENNFVVCFYTTNRHSCVLVCVETNYFIELGMWLVVADNLCLANL